MDYDANFRTLQSALTHCDEFVKKFDKISYYGGKKMILFKNLNFKFKF